MRKVFGLVPWGPAMKAGWTILAPVIIALLTTLATNRVLRPSLNLKFEPEAPMITTADRRAPYDNDLYAIKVETDGTLKNAVARLMAISKSADLSNPLNSVVQPAFGWPVGADSFQPRTIGPVDYIIVAFGKKDSDGNSHIQFFFNEFYGNPGPESHPMHELDFLKDLEPGIYFMQIAVLADDFKPVTKTVRIDWERPSSFKMTIIK